MPATPIGAFVYNTSLPYTQQRPEKYASANTNDTLVPVVAGNFCRFSTYSTLTLIACDDDAIVVWGFAQTAIPAATAEPYTSPWGPVINAIDVLNTRFVVNLKDGATVIPVLGTSYGLDVVSGVPYIDTAETTSLFFKAEALFPGDVSTDTTPRYVCSIVASRQ